MPTSNILSFAVFAAGLLLLPVMIGLVAIRLDRRDREGRVAARRCQHT